MLTASLLRDPVRATGVTCIARLVRYLIGPGKRDMILGREASGKVNGDTTPLQQLESYLRTRDLIARKGAT